MFPSRIFHVKPEPKRIPEVLRPVEASSSGGEIVVLQQGWVPVDEGETIACKSLKEIERLGVGREGTIDSPQPLELLDRLDPDLLTGHWSAQPQLGNA